ncbi:MAG: peptide deformylase [Planctomycetaceae bacterium]|nr:MAG: peptide deformylase [Planctomycetaceae bacterium]
MISSEKIAQADIASLTVIKYPDPRLAEVGTPVVVFDQKLRQLAERMFELMFATKGVGLAANQVGITVQMFVASPSYESDDRLVCVNPKIVEADGWMEDEEGCLSVPGINVSINRRAVVKLQAQDLDGNVFEITGTELLARIIQHETDHLNGMLIIDKMGSVAKLASRRTIRQLEEKYAKANQA